MNYLIRVNCPECPFYTTETCVKTFLSEYPIEIVNKDGRIEIECQMCSELFQMDVSQDVIIEILAND